GKIASGQPQSADGSHSHAHGHIADVLLTVQNRLPAIADRLQLVAREEGSAPIVQKIRFLLAFQEKGCAADIECVYQMSRDDIQQFENIFAQPKLLAKRV